MAIIQKAGAIILSQKEPTHVALLYRSKQNDWTFPKGHVEIGESIVETTRREIMEETGLNSRLIGELPLMEYNNQNNDRVVVSMFIMQSENDTTTKTEFLGDKIIWVFYKDIADKLSYDNIKQYYRTVVKIIEDSIKKIQDS